MDVDAYKEKSDELAANRFNTIDLFLAFHKMLEKKKSRKVLETKITPDESTIDEKMATIQLEMQQRNAKRDDVLILFHQLQQNRSRYHFHGIIRINEKGYIRVEQEGNYESILLYPAGKTDE